MKQYSYEELAMIGRKYYSDSNFCSVVAISVACNVGFGKAYHTLRREGRQTKKGVIKPVIDRAIANLGFELVSVPDMYNKQAKSLTKVLPKEGCFLVHFRGHVAAIRDGVLVDWTEKRAHRTWAVYAIIPKRIES
jgi:hypothetical protein